MSHPNPYSNLSAVGWFSLQQCIIFYEMIKCLSRGSKKSTFHGLGQTTKKVFKYFIHLKPQRQLIDSCLRRKLDVALKSLITFWTTNPNCLPRRLMENGVLWSRHHALQHRFIKETIGSGWGSVTSVVPVIWITHLFEFRCPLLPFNNLTILFSSP